MIHALLEIPRLLLEMTTGSFVRPTGQDISRFLLRNEEVARAVARLSYPAETLARQHALALKPSQPAGTAERRRDSQPATG